MAAAAVRRTIAPAPRPERLESGMGGMYRLSSHFQSLLWPGGSGGSTVCSLVSAPNPVPPPPAFLLFDTLTDPGFSVGFTSTVPVSGGGNALFAAVNAAGPNTRLLVTDSLVYSEINIVGKTNITVQADVGQTPSIQADPGTSLRAVRIGSGNSGIAIIGMTLIGNGNHNGASQLDDGIVLGTSVTGMASIDRVIIQNCIFKELNPALGTPGIQLVGADGTAHDNVQIIGCTFIDVSTPASATFSGYGAVTVGGFNHVFVQDCKITRSAVARASSNMRGVVVKNLASVVEDVLCHDIGTAGPNDNFKHNDENIFGSAVGSSVWRNNVAFDAKRAYVVTLGGVTMTVTDSVVYNADAGIAAGQTLVQQGAGTMVFRDSIIDSAGDGTAFSATVTEDHNDVFNVAAPGKVLDVTDLTIDPVLTNPALNDYRATAPAVKVGSSDGGAMGVRYPGGTGIFWAGFP